MTPNNETPRKEPRETKPGWTAVPPEYEDEVKPSRSQLMARAFDLGVEGYEMLTDDELIEAIRRQEELLARSLQ